MHGTNNIKNTNVIKIHRILHNQELHNSTAYVTPVHKFSKKIKKLIQNYGSQNFHTENPQILEATIQNLIVRATWLPWCVHS